jgi:D-alanyl-D-alanine carboxypeptidase (penicillin-binding protein 5/6)
MRKGRIAIATLLVVLAWAAAAAFALHDDEGGGRAGVIPEAAITAVTPDGGTAPVTRPRSKYTLGPVPADLPVKVEFADPPRAGVLFDVDTGEVLWALHPRREAPIASLTKMLTGLIIAERHGPRERVLITEETVNYAGSGVGVLPLGKRVPLNTMLHGLMLVSGNDAAIALAQHDGGTQNGFVERMNERSEALGMTCSHFSNASGIRDAGNYSCPVDLAALARADLDNPWLGKVVGTRRARFPFPVKGGVLDLWNINPFLARGDPGVTGVKTGLTTAAGRCYVITARMGGRHLGVVLLDTPDPYAQVPRLLQAGARVG